MTAKPEINVSRQPELVDQIRAELGTGAMSGFFRRGDRTIVHIPRVGRTGYTESASGHNGPAEVHTVSVEEIWSQLDATFECLKWKKNNKGDWESDRVSFPREAVRLAVATPSNCTGLPVLNGVTHTPMARADGSILDTPGYDEATGLVYLPDPGLQVLTVPATPSDVEVKEAADLLQYMIADFPFVTPQDRVNYLGMLITPVIRELAPPPYKLGAVGAPMRGSGKSFLVDAMRTIHGGVLRLDMNVKNTDEMEKQVATILTDTTAPVVQYDNVTGVIRSGVLDGLLTSSTWSGRLLGSNREGKARNDRVWMITGNNLAIAGDLMRRTLHITIDPQTPKPENRTGFQISDFPGWVAAHRGELLRAMLILVRAWHVAGRPMRPRRSSDSYAQWIQIVDGILHNAGVEEFFDSPEATPDGVDHEDGDWEKFLFNVHQEFGDQKFYVKDVLARINTNGYAQLDVGRPLPVEILPGDVQEVMDNSRKAATKLGYYMRNRAGRWAGSYVVEQAGADRNKVMTWRVKKSS